MNCIECGKAVEGGARFCADCKADTTNSARASTTEMQPNKRLSAIWLVLVLVALIGTYAAVLIPALAGQQSDSAGMFGCLLWTALLFFLLWKRSDRTPWVGAVIGAALGLAFVIGSDVVSRASSASQLDDTLFSSVDHFDPAAGAALRGIRSDKPTVQRQLQPLLARAIQTTSDRAILGLVDAQQSLLDPRTPSGLSRCAAAASGRAPADVGAVSRDEEEAVTLAMAEVFQTADMRRTLPSTDIERLQKLVQPIYANADPTNALQDPDKFRGLPDQQQCAIYRGLMNGIRSLPEAAMVFRYMMSRAAVSA